MGAPGGQVQSYIRYGHGIDKIQEVLMLACDVGLIDKAGAWYTCSFMADDSMHEVAKRTTDVSPSDDDYLTKFKFQGQDNLYEFLKGNPECVSFLESQIKEFC